MEAHSYTEEASESDNREEPDYDEMNNEDQGNREYMDDYVEESFFENFMKSKLNRHKCIR
jgi:hypothetical protein